MPSKSIAQQHLMQAAEHGADFPMADRLRQTMSPDQLHDFSVGPETGKPEHVPPPPSLIHGSTPMVVGSNTSTLRQGGQSEFEATRNAIQLGKMGVTPKGHPNRHKNLGKWLHPKKGQ